MWGHQCSPQPGLLRSAHGQHRSYCGSHSVFLHRWEEMSCVAGCLVQWSSHAEFHVAVHDEPDSWTCPSVHGAVRRPSKGAQEGPTVLGNKKLMLTYQRKKHDIKVTEQGHRCILKTLFWPSDFFLQKDISAFSFSSWSHLSPFVYQPLPLTRSRRVHAQEEMLWGSFLTLFSFHWNV